MTVNKGGVISKNHRNDELYTTRETAEDIYEVYKDTISKYSIILMSFNSKGSEFENVLLANGVNVKSFNTDFFEEDFNTYKNALILDNPPFSKFGKILKRCSELGLDYILFGSSMSLFHHLRRDYVTGFDHLGRLKFVGSDIKVNVGLYNNINFKLTNNFQKNKTLRPVKLKIGELYSSGKIISRLENGQSFDGRCFSHYNHKPFGGGMIYNPQRRHLDCKN